ncbi:hypothetical protein HanRHA438_Chr14g0664631 [Helianthus annuus]|uniref:Uncharacterized protein n=1 Tax=Helianthus annuus TaxID=4232 RepID=A0A251SMX1_HELAN|nr:hypothetical protein HanHA300_Chr14g0532291 [Helianthus annuus]KAJ0486476.1 hypothetical protein HanHA89_Chr14g0580091 [Helianthus annuus]KAJ0657042.1 hypothetical protein HanLR1_Chr14g0542671 [Helianthus annuus]KAJ0660625.1 hypothetical protein HanOQP8_Chr14g0539851 [Helianthus annuus]KAJ0704310.1 hypothetical protein HanPI659440_Chr14g0561271 [Helianthus annuus]
MAPITIYSGINEELPKDQGRCCFRMPCKADDNRCWSKGLSSFMEWSQLVVVPKFKTFIRQFNTQRGRHAKFQYDPTSYLLNFDEGVGYLEDDDQDIPSFSARYSLILVPGKPSMNLEEDEPVFPWQ